MAAKKKEEVVVDESITETKVETIVTEEIKYRYEFKSWEEYNKYKGAKG